MEQLTAQEIFDKVYKHFIIDKNPRSISTTGATCYYRGPNGEKCAVGILIDDKDYNEYMEGHSMENLLTIDAYDYIVWRIKPQFINHLDLLSFLQVAHDQPQSKNFYEFKLALDTARVRFGLQDNFIS